MLDGKPCKPWTIGEFSLDKRHFSDMYPTPPLPQPPKVTPTRTPTSTVTRILTLTRTLTLTHPDHL